MQVWNNFSLEQERNKELQCQKLLLSTAAEYLVAVRHETEMQSVTNRRLAARICQGE